MLTEKKPEQKADEVLAEISTVISSMDGIATGDAFKLGGLVKRYGECCASEAMAPLIESMIGSLEKSMNRKPPSEPWEGR